MCWGGKINAKVKIKNEIYHFSFCHSFFLVCHSRLRSPRWSYGEAGGNLVGDKF
jgi:hypothetical protein